MSLEIHIRPFNQLDYASVRKNLENAGLFYEPMDSLEMYTRLLEDGNMIFVAEAEGRIVGSILVLKSWGPFIFRLAVSEKVRNQGVGALLAQKGEEFLIQLGQPEVHILVDLNDAELQEYYTKRGFDSGGAYRWMTKTFKREGE